MDTAVALTNDMETVCKANESAEGAYFGPTFYNTS